MIKPRLYRGMRDLNPEEAQIQEGVLDVVKSIFLKYGFIPLKTPAIEYLDILAGKYGPESENLFYTLSYKDGRTLALRYDLTVPLARFIGMNQHQLPRIYKRYQIQNVWRAERAQPQKGRFREFLQCDVDTVGTTSLVADAEILALSIECLSKLGFQNYVIKLNHRKLLRGLLNSVGIDAQGELTVCRILDKLDKIGRAGVQEELTGSGLNQKQTESIFSFFDLSGSNKDKIDYLKEELNTDLVNLGLRELKEVFELLTSFGIPSDKVIFDTSLARGLDYYTGLIFETVLPDHPQIGSLTGGGRYDDLIGMFSNREIPAVGTTIGVDRIITALNAVSHNPFQKAQGSVLVTALDSQFQKVSIQLAASLRKHGISVNLFPESEGIRFQLSYANKMGYRFVILIGEEEVRNMKFTLKNMTTGSQQAYSTSELIELFRKESGLK
ncbi:histidine--tRNA ligase [bacterium]|nr:histidine--tRNA ligase [bacterium]